ncbi:TetR/AcrR family transcriptional regulator C-terminal domain-containing protein [Actinoplanes bogorensis]|uniref:TetR/AcrR family transcriptional regulator C-terminal domain-containing protein n=1 Tax=Paractinoplanes bogorensis TaxID=1610840 RepID=A0ABS5YFQ6_9ACTN|nr:TetR/AcrR family transcriptional regulator C-terminal domain-containing protein [Actinoplanes bogorensis]MBU2662168.1 TetR/AcrR family transcriptional regulator C-terminal domain-containing protein [Actinoplanes bogorensis]
MALDRQRIVTEAVALLDAEGLDAVTTRKLAARLGVQSPTLYWHVPNKAALVTAIADAILDQEFATTAAGGKEEEATAAGGEDEDQPWPQWLTGLAERLRRALLAHPDGARVVSSAQLSRTMAAISEQAMSTLVAQGIPLRQARVIVLTVERFTVGHVLEEQAARPDAAALKDFDLNAFTAEHPTVVAAITDYFHPGRTVDDLFRDCLDVVIAGAVVSAGDRR